MIKEIIASNVLHFDIGEDTPQGKKFKGNFLCCLQSDENGSYSCLTYSDAVK
jgi:hypothetical protein